MMEEGHPTIREFRETDLFPLKSLVQRTIAVCYPGHYCTEAVRFFTSYHSEQAILQDAREGCTLVLDRAGRIMATGTLVGDEIKRVFVDFGFQKHGLGRLIMRHLEERAALFGIETVRLHASLPSRAFYDRLGYAIVEEAFLQVENGRSLDFFKMRKTLSAQQGR